MPTSRDRLFSLEVVCEGQALPEIMTDQGSHVVALPGKSYRLRVSAPRVERSDFPQSQGKLMNGVEVTIDGTRLPIHKFELERDIIGFGLGVGRGHRAFTFANPPAVINISDDDDDIKVDPETMEEPIGMISAQFLVMEKQVYYTHAPRTPHQPRPVPVQRGVPPTDAGKFWQVPLSTKPGDFIPPPPRDEDPEDFYGEDGSVRRFRFVVVERLATLTVRYASFDSLMISGVVDMLKPSHFRYIPRAHFLKAPYTLVTCIAGLLQQFGPALNIDELGRLFQEHTGVEWGLVNRITLKLFITSNSRYFAYGMDDLVRLKPNTVGRIAATAASKALAPSNRMQIDCDRQQPDIAEALDISDDVDIAVLPGPPPSAVNAKRAGVPREKQKLKRPRMTPAASSVGSSNMDVANPDVSPAAVGAAMAVNPETPAPADVLRADPMQLDVPVPINLDDEDDF